MPVGSRVTPSGFQAKPVKRVARRYSVASQRAAKRRRNVGVACSRAGGNPVETEGLGSRLRGNTGWLNIQNVPSVARPG
jgi:hypothetical protein